MLKAESVSLELNGRAIVRNINFSLRNGELMAVVGANGAGKSSLISLLNGSRKPTEGRVILDERDIASYNTRELAFKRTTLAQHNPVNLNFHTEEIVLMGRYPYFTRTPGQKDVRVIQEAMEICGISELADRSYLRLSGGEQQRVQLARVLAQLWDQPGGLLLLDEPVSGLDPLYQHQTLSIARAMSRQGFKVIAVLHDLNLASQYADRILMMKSGRRWKDGPPAELLNPMDIYAVFGIEAEVVMNPKTLTPYIVPKDIRLNISDFNSCFPPAIPFPIRTT